MTQEEMSHFIEYCLVIACTLMLLGGCRTYNQTAQVFYEAGDMDEDVDLIWEKTMEGIQSQYDSISKSAHPEDTANFWATLEESVEMLQFPSSAKLNGLKSKNNNELYYILLVSVVVILLIVVGLCARKRIVKKDSELNNYILLSKNLQGVMSDKKSQMSDLFKKQYELLDKLSNIYYDTSVYHNDKERDAIYEQVKSEIASFSQDKKMLASLENIINTCKNNVLSIIREEIPGISERDMRLLCYVYAGFSAKSISVFMGETTNNILTRKHRLRTKIKSLSSPNVKVMLDEMP